ncbi:amidase, Asp-tRNAAsn/Glu-tRNAGln amidotransferase A subunit [Rhizobium sp. CF142]|nr:amidase, Asp-tRNAAsn/Glu-tRNAGln amidotransferase A subunit [Rhizobium sp. CF142]
MMDATALAAEIADGKISAQECTDNAILAIEDRDREMNAVVVHAFDAARQQAAEADRKRASGERLPLLGVPITIKESFDVAGLPTSWGLEVFRDAIASEDAVSVARLRKAGAVILGKTNVSEGLDGWNASNPVYGRTNHPMNANWTPGGSSAGAAAAVAAGLSALDIGSDLGGSIRLPAHFCGIYGHNASAGLIPLRGHVLNGRKARLDMSAPGPMARSARDVALGLAIMAGPDDDEATSFKLELPPPRHQSIRIFAFSYWIAILRSPPITPYAEPLRPLPPTLRRSEPTFVQHGGSCPTSPSYSPSTCACLVVRSASARALKQDAAFRRRSTRLRSMIGPYPPPGCAQA